MNQSPEFDRIIKDLAGAENVAFFIPENPSLDLVAASLSFFLAFSKSRKRASLVCSSPMTVGFSQLVGLNRISTKVGGRNLVVSFEYLENAIDKVSYNIEDKKFNLVIQPKPGFSPLSSENVAYSHSGDLDLLVVIGAQTLNSLGPVYQEEASLFDQGQVLNIDINSANSRFGKTNGIFSTASSYSEVVVILLKAGGYSLDPDMANNLLLGIAKATNSFIAPGTSPDAFEAAAFCLRNGARRQPILTKPAEGRLRAKSGLSLKTMSKDESAVRSPEEKDVSGKILKKRPVPDWYGPKVFRGSKRI